MYQPLPQQCPQGILHTSLLITFSVTHQRKTPEAGNRDLEFWFFVLLCDRHGTPGSWDRFESWLSQWVAVMALGELLNFSGPKFPQGSTGLDFRMPFSNIVLPFCGTGIAHGCPKDPLIAPGNRWLHWDPFGWWFQGSDLQGKWLRKAAGGNRKDLGLTGTQPITCLPVPFAPPPTPTHPGVPPWMSLFYCLDERVCSPSPFPSHPLHCHKNSLCGSASKIISLLGVKLLIIYYGQFVFVVTLNAFRIWPQCYILLLALTSISRANLQTVHTALVCVLPDYQALYQCSDHLSMLLIFWETYFLTNR